MAEAQLYPGARWTPLGMQAQPRMRAHDILCYHTMVGYLLSTDRYFRITNGEGFRGTESHYGVGGKWGPDLGGDLDGACWQWQDRAYTADANGEGNGVVISVEIADNAVRPIQAWTPRQLDRLVDIGWWECSPKAHAACPPTWQCHRSGIPATLIPDTKPGRRGIGYHRQGCPPNIVAGGLAWSSSMGKDCPTQVRIDQLVGIVIPRIRARMTTQVPVKDPKPAPLEEDDMKVIIGIVSDFATIKVPPGAPHWYALHANGTMTHIPSYPQLANLRERGWEDLGGNKGADWCTTYTPVNGPLAVAIAQSLLPPPQEVKQP